MLGFHGHIGVNLEPGQGLVEDVGRRCSRHPAGNHQVQGLIDEVNAGFYVVASSLKISGAFYEFVGIGAIAHRQGFKSLGEVFGAPLAILHLLLQVEQRRLELHGFLVGHRADDGRQPD